MYLNEIFAKEIYLAKGYSMVKDEQKSTDFHLVYRIDSLAEDGVGIATSAALYFNPHWHIKVGYGQKMHTVTTAQARDEKAFIDWCRYSIVQILDSGEM